MIVPLCPIEPAHGRLLDWPTDKWGYYCAAQSHDGRTAHHLGGSLSPTLAFFTTAQVEEANA